MKNLNNRMSQLKNLLSSLLLFLVLISCEANNNNYKSGIQEKEKINETISVEEFAKLITNDAQLIDVRTTGEFAGGFISNADNIDINSTSFKDKVQKYNKQKPILVYCLSGGRSSQAAEVLSEMGFLEVYNLKGGIMKWEASGKPLNQAGARPNTLEMSLTQFNSKINEKTKVLVDFYAPWCVPCKKMAPYLEKIKNENPGNFLLLKINADENKSLCKEVGVEGLPVLEYYENGKKIWRHEGLIEEKELRKRLGL